MGSSSVTAAAAAAKKEGGLCRSWSSRNSSPCVGIGIGKNVVESINNKNGSRRRQQRRCSFTRKCARLVKEQRARFYIMRRCVTMLICWREYTDS